MIGYRNGWARAACLGVLLAALLGSADRAAAQPSGEEEEPWNIVFILADDLAWNQTGYGWNSLAYPGSGFYETPNVDRLAQQGMTFSDAYSVASICSPTRAGLMTGRHPARLHITDYIPGSPYPWARLTTPRMATMLPLEEITIAELLKVEGYVTGHFGKWHLNVDKEYEPGRPGDPASQGFDEVYTSVKPEPDADPSEDPHHAEEITTRSLDFLDRHADEPFFLYVSHHVVHRPLHEREEKIAKYRVKPGAILAENEPTMGAMIETMDEGVGRILEKIEALGVADRTIVIFYSDNGGLELLQDQEPLRGGKAMLWEGGIRVPLVVRWPGVVEPGSVSSTPVTSTDFFPTIAEMVGADADGDDGRPIDGVSLVPLLEGGTIADRALFWHYPHYHHLGYKPSGAIRDGRWKLIEWYETSLTDQDEAVSLYDLSSDIGETYDLADENPEKAAELLAKLRSWRAEVGAQEMTVNRDYDPERAHLRGVDD